MANKKEKKIKIDIILPNYNKKDFILISKKTFETPAQQFSSNISFSILIQLFFYIFILIELL